MSKRISFTPIELEILEKMVRDRIGKDTQWVNSVITHDFKKRLLKKLTGSDEL